MNHNRKKQLKAEKNRANGLRPDGQPLIREGDNQREEQLIGGNENRPAGGRQPNINEDGMIVPFSMRNYRERTVMGGFIKLRKYDRIDLFWGFLKN